MVSWPFWPRGRLLGPKAPISQKITYFYENGWIGARKHNFHVISPFMWNVIKILKLTFGYLLCFKTLRQIGVLSPRAAKVCFWAPKSTFRAKAHFWPQECLFAQKCILDPKGYFRWFGWKRNNPEWEFILFRYFCGFCVPVMHKVMSYENPLILYYFMKKWILCHFMIFAPCHENNLNILPPL